MSTALEVRSYAQVRGLIHTGDIALFDGDGFGSDIIERATGKPYGVEASHAGLLLCPWSANVLMIAEAWRPVSRCVEFSSRVKEASGHTHVFRLRTDLLALVNFDKLVEFALRATNVDYPEDHLVKAARSIISGKPIRRVPNSDDPKEARQCSELVAAMFRISGLPAQPEPKNLDCMNWPVDWSNPALVTGMFTLTFP